MRLICIYQNLSRCIIEVSKHFVGWIRDQGFSYRISLGDSTLQELANIIDLERKCCPFLNFKLAIDAGTDSALLGLSGRDGTKELIRTLFDWN